MRDLAMLCAMFAMVPLAFANAFNAFLLWGYTALLAPNTYLFGFMQGIRYNLIFAVIALWLWISGRVQQKGKFNWNRSTIVLLWLAIQITLSAIFGYGNNPWNWEYYQIFIKSLIFALLIPIFVTSRLRIHALILVFCLAIGFHGVTEGLKVIVTAGGHKVRGIPGTMFGDNNHLAVGLCMILPLLVYLALNTSNKLARLGSVFGLILTVLAVIGTSSRGGFICLSLLAIWYTLTSRRKILGLTVIVLCGGLVLVLAPESWFSRIETIKEASQDDSFLGRVIAWKVSTAIAVENPIFGGGIHAAQASAVWNEFIYKIDLMRIIATPPPGTIPRAAHSIYFEILGDIGFVGLGIFLILIAVGFRNASQIKKMVLNRPELNWARDLADGGRLALLAYCIGGAAVSLGYLEFFYVLIMLLEGLRQHVIRELNASERSLKNNTVIAGNPYEVLRR